MKDYDFIVVDDSCNETRTYGVKEDEDDFYLFEFDGDFSTSYPKRGLNWMTNATRYYPKGIK